MSGEKIISNFEMTSNYPRFYKKMLDKPWGGVEWFM